MATPTAIILTGYGINCEEETCFAFTEAGARASIVHINDIIDSPGVLRDARIFAFPGGFSYGDDTGSGKALANRIRNNLLEEFREFVARDTLMLGICNGFQVMVNLGIVPGLEGHFSRVEVSLEHNLTARYQCRWVHLVVEKNSPSVFTRNIERLYLPVAHGEGNFYAPADTLSAMEKRGLAVMRYTRPDGGPAAGEFPVNPNGSLNDIAAVCDTTGRIMGLMPHPERNIHFVQMDGWTLKKEHARREGMEIPQESDGMSIFRNAVSYFS